MIQPQHLYQASLFRQTNCRQSEIANFSNAYCALLHMTFSMRYCALSSQSSRNQKLSRLHPGLTAELQTFMSLYSILKIASGISRASGAVVARPVCIRLINSHYPVRTIWGKSRIGKVLGSIPKSSSCFLTHLAMLSFFCSTT